MYVVIYRTTSNRIARRDPKLLGIYCTSLTHLDPVALALPRCVLRSEASYALKTDPRCSSVIPVTLVPCLDLIGLLLRGTIVNRTKCCQ